MIAVSTCDGWRLHLKTGAVRGNPIQTLSSASQRQSPGTKSAPAIQHLLLLQHSPRGSRWHCLNRRNPVPCVDPSSALTLECRYCDRFLTVPLRLLPRRPHRRPACSYSCHSLARFRLKPRAIHPASSSALFNPLECRSTSVWISFNFILWRSMSISLPSSTIHAR